MVLDFQVVNMMLLPGRKQGSHMNMNIFSLLGNLCGPILLICWKVGVNPHTKSLSRLLPMRCNYWVNHRPEKSYPGNETHNYYVSSIRIRSEHCVGFLKGHWSSLHHLWVHINNQHELMYATLWVITCIHLHNFAMAHECHRRDFRLVKLSQLYCLP